MKLSPSSDFLSYANAGSKIMQWRSYVKITTTLSQSLAAGPWIEVTDRIVFEKMPDISTQIEYQIGQFTSPNISLEARDIAWWRANIFTSTYLSNPTYYLEFKIELQLGIGAALASDIVYMFAGFIDKVGLEFNELDDTVQFSVFGADDIGTRIAGENVVTRFINPDIDGTATQGLVLQGIPGLYFKSANVASRVLMVGVHTITYQVVGTVKKIKLDSGAQLNISASNTTYTIGDVDNTFANDTQEVLIYVKDIMLLPSVGTFTDQVIVLNAGDVLPYQWYRNILARSLLAKLYSQIGISSISFDTMEMKTFDGANRVSYYGVPPNDTNILGTMSAMATDGTDLFISIGNLVYKRSTLDGTYTRIASLTSGVTVKKLLYNARNQHLWIAYQVGAPMLMKRLDLSSMTLSAEVNLDASAVGSETAIYSLELLDYNYTGTSWKYGIVYADAHDDLTNQPAIRFLDSPSLTISYATARNSLINTHFMFQPSPGKIWYKATSTGDDYYELQVDSTGAFVSNGLKLSNVAAYTNAAFNSAVARVYYSFSGVIASHDLLTNAVSTHLGISGSNWLVAGNPLTYFVTSSTPYSVYSISGTASAILMASVDGSVNQGSLCYIDRVYGISNASNQLWHCDTNLPFIITLADLGGMTIRDAINKVLRAFNLIGVLSFAKKASVYRRADTTGTPQTTGNTLSLTVREASQLVETTKQNIAVQYVRIISKGKTTTYDGTSFNSQVLSDKNTLEINNDFIPDVIAKDLCYYVYQFFKTDRNLNRIRCDALPLFHFEPLDNVNLTFTTTKIQKTVSGLNNPIYAMLYRKDGSMEVQALI